jgi:hypothetical protein
MDVGKLLLIAETRRTHVHQSAPARAGSLISRERNEEIPLVTFLIRTYTIISDIYGDKYVNLSRLTH